MPFVEDFGEDYGGTNKTKQKQQQKQKTRTQKCRTQHIKSQARDQNIHFSEHWPGHSQGQALIFLEAREILLE